MLTAALLAFALLAQEAPPVDLTVSAPAPMADPAAPAEGPIPPGAPEDDYGLVSWCHGALTGHMALYDQVKPALDSLSTDASRADQDQQQMTAGREYLALYERAVVAAETANPRLRPRGVAARRKGEGIWTPAANAVDPRTTMWSWLMWELPGRCETAALRLETASTLLAPALSANTPPPADAVAAEPAANRDEAAPVDEPTAADQEAVPPSD